MSSHKGKGKEVFSTSLAAAAIAGSVESFVSFPLESIKTQLQLNAYRQAAVVSYIYVPLTALRDRHSLSELIPLSLNRRIKL